MVNKTPDAINNLEDSINQVNDNDPNDANKGDDTLIQDGEPSRREKHKIKLKPWDHYVIQHVKKKKAKNM
ncbi:hypothetical protein H5410_037422 [Solanum commersonii]|uniref:Uncharacterized protein n=1 Tax=Solanum commersonii TaxID=4109 RepID=A0A9J5YB68_SOLCO|nr:hypothetical protein H5410_037422 [Solanum commersonii]